MGTRQASEDEGPIGGEGGDPGIDDPTDTEEPPVDLPTTCASGAPLPLPTRRFDFSGEGTELIDRQGGESGSILGGAALDGSGSLTLDGEDDYVDLPNHILGGKSVTILLWLNSDTKGSAYRRIFDFGTTADGEDPEPFTIGSHYVALATGTGFDPSGLALLIGQGGPQSQDHATTSLILEGGRVAFAVVLDDAAGIATLYVDGIVAAETLLSGSIADIDDVNNWLGRSQYSADPYYRGVYEELRIYEQVLSACEISRLKALGPDRVE